MQLLDGKKIAAEIRGSVKARLAETKTQPGLGVVLVGNDAPSHLYVGLKEKACKEVGIRFERSLLPDTATEAEIIAAVEALNARDDIDAILVQLPLPAGINESAVISAMAPNKDVDGFHPKNLELLETNQAPVLPVLIHAIVKLLDATGEPLTGKQAALFANSTVFAHPLSTALSWRGVHSTITLGKHMANPADLVQDADIVIVALGKPKFLRAKDVRDNTILIDVGTNTLPDGAYVGDIDAAGSETKPGWITPVPGGVGPVTVAMILENVLALSDLRRIGGDKNPIEMGSNANAETTK